MAPRTKRDSLISLRLGSELKEILEDAALVTGQSLDDFVRSTLAPIARRILHDRQVTQLSDRDCKLIAAMLDNESSEPNNALEKAANRYRNQVR